MFTVNHDFLAFTRANEWSIEQTSEFTLDNGTEVRVLDTGVIQFTPQNPGAKAIVLSCAVHGNETAPIEICSAMVQEILAGELSLAHRCLFLFANPASMNIGERFVEENMNRLFSGAHSKGNTKNRERERAKKLEGYVKGFFDDTPAQNQKIHYDLHTAIRAAKYDKFAVYPFRHGRPWDKKQLSFLLACGVNTILLSNSPTTTFSYFSSNEFSADAFTVELGKVRGFGENNMADFTLASKSLRELVSQQEVELKPFDENDFHIFDIYKTINRYHENFTLNFPDDEKNFTDFPVGYVLANDNGEEHKVTAEGEAIVFPNAKVALGQRALLTVIPTRI